MHRTSGPLLRESIEEWDRRALLACTGAEALELLAREPVALVLLDHQLPDMSGTELVDRLRAEHRAVPPLVLMTGEARTPRPDWPELVGVLRKPFELSELAALLERRPPHG
jgi:CheY-like chemotaxis protein